MFLIPILVGRSRGLFVISGFFLTKNTLARNNINVKNSFLHRVKRLYPPYIVVIVIAALYAVLLKMIPMDILTHLTFTQNFQWIITEYISPMQPMTAHTWTLSIEVWCGLILMIVLKYTPREKLVQVLAGIMCFSVVFRIITIISGSGIYTISLSPIAHLDAFAIGAVLAVLMSKKDDAKLEMMAKGSIILGLLGILLSIIILAKTNNVNFIEGYTLLRFSKNYLDNAITGNIYLYISLLSVGVLYLLIVYDSKRIKSESENNLMVWLGNKSYELYLFHWPILVVVDHFVNSWIFVFTGTLFVTVIAALIYGVTVKRIKGVVS